MRGPYRPLGTSVSARVRMPPLSLLVDIMLGTVTSGSSVAFWFAWVLANANSIVSDAAENMTSAIRLLVLFLYVRVTVCVCHFCRNGCSEVVKKFAQFVGTLAGVKNMLHSNVKNRQEGENRE